MVTGIITGIEKVEKPETVAEMEAGMETEIENLGGKIGETKFFRGFTMFAKNLKGDKKEKTKNARLFQKFVRNLGS